MAYEIKNEFLNENGTKYNLRNISFLEKESLNKNIGTFICETKNEKNGMFYSSNKDIEDGVYIYKTNYDRKKALRIYKDWAQYKYIHHAKDATLVNELLIRQPDIKLTDFPTGIITLENYVIGQEIPLYENYKTLLEIAKIKESKYIIKYYLDMIAILAELYKRDIIYKDCHSKNFLINDETNEVKLIDFEPDKVILKKDLYDYKKMISCLKENINRINGITNIPFKLDKEQTLEEVEELILSKKYN